MSTLKGSENGKTKISPAAQPSSQFVSKIKRPPDIIYYEASVLINRLLNTIMDFITKIKEWYRGEYIPPPENDPNSGVVFVSSGYYKKPLLAKAIEVASKFFMAHWQWIIGTTIAVVALYLQFTQ
ncbi:hypothetical protein [Methylophaga thiooxydans]|uniref:hypothetical protein n=1 Tax=Methylophaga thiooxydans TaxID=392484 RepID=UPI002352CE24|nr:hypothetical protein [Methylophaga thiooxydans]